MKLGVMQPYCFPYIGYFQLYNLVDKFIYLHDVNYINKGWINRNRILINASSTEYLFTIPLKKASQNKKINEIELAEDYLSWKRKFLQTLKHYKAESYFDLVYPLLNKILEPEKTIDLQAIKSVEEIAKYLDINKETELSSKYELLKGEQRILTICKQNNVSTYINPIGGIELYSKENFEREKINLLFLKPNDKLPKLSIIDLLMRHSKVEIKEMLGEFECV